MPPDVGTVNAAIDFLLDGCGLTEADLPAFVEKFPEVLGCSVDDQLQVAVDTLAKSYFIPKGKFLVKTLKRKPECLGYNLDCTAIGSGACAGECNRCWVRL